VTVIEQGRPERRRIVAMTRCRFTTTWQADLFRVICEQDMEGVVAEQRNGRSTPDATTWVKIKNRT
jgi:hypothetical protein